MAKPEANQRAGAKSEREAQRLYPAELLGLEGKENQPGDVFATTTCVTPSACRRWCCATAGFLKDGVSFFWQNIMSWGHLETCHRGHWGSDEILKGTRELSEKWRT